ncbi:MAG: MmgE/PrpD family protein, partial [Ignavibacteria bacterium]|nr:MmgE/PrpD family protein [Ignavibacteria bacterium]
MEKSFSRQIAEFAVNLKFEDLPGEVVNEVKRYLYDSMGCAYGGYHTKDVNILRDIYKEMGGSEQATLIGFGDRVPAVNAALINSL